MIYWISPWNEYFKTRPQRVRLPDGSTRTGEEVTDELLAELGWTQTTYYPEPEPEPIEPNATAGSNTTAVINQSGEI